MAGRVRGARLYEGIVIYDAMTRGDVHLTSSWTSDAFSVARAHLDTIQANRFSHKHVRDKSFETR
jgi:hypothetical protein